MSKLSRRTIIITQIAIVVFFVINTSFGQVPTTNEEFSVQIDGSKHFQKMDGFGVNINTSWWLDGDYRNTDIVKPAIDMLHDELGATIFRAVIEDMDWE